MAYKIKGGFLFINADCVLLLVPHYCNEASRAIRHSEEDPISLLGGTNVEDVPPQNGELIIPIGGA